MLLAVGALCLLAFAAAPAHARIGQSQPGRRNLVGIFDKKPVGNYCTLNGDCISGHCIRFTCAMGGENNTCDNDGQCYAEACAGGKCFCNAGRCRQKRNAAQNAVIGALAKEGLLDQMVQREKRKQLAAAAESGYYPTEEVCRAACEGEPSCISYKWNTAGACALTTGQCPAGKVYKRNGPGTCIRTCADPDPSCTAQSKAGCYCPPERPIAWIRPDGMEVCVTQAACPTKEWQTAFQLGFYSGRAQQQQQCEKREEALKTWGSSIAAAAATCEKKAEEYTFDISDYKHRLMMLTKQLSELSTENKKLREELGIAPKFK